MPGCLCAHGLLCPSEYVHKFISHNPASVLKRENLYDNNIEDNPTACRQTKGSSSRLQIYHLHLKNSPGSWSYTESLPAWIPGLNSLRRLYCNQIRGQKFTRFDWSYNCSWKSFCKKYFSTSRLLRPISLFTISNSRYN